MQQCCQCKTITKPYSDDRIIGGWICQHMPLTCHHHQSYVDCSRLQSMFICWIITLTPAIYACKYPAIAAGKSQAAPSGYEVAKQHIQTSALCAFNISPNY